MKTVLCSSFGFPEILGDDSRPAPRHCPRQVVVAVTARGKSFPRTLLLQGKYDFTPEFPLATGSIDTGIVKVIQIASVPDRAATISTTMSHATARHALGDRAQLMAGETLLILGAAGECGLAAIDIAKEMGAQVIAAASTDARLEICRQRGADFLVNYARDDWGERVKEMTRGKGVNVVFDPVGREYAGAALRQLTWNGRYLVIGFTPGDITKIPFNMPLLKGYSVVGVCWGELGV